MRVKALPIALATVVACSSEPAPPESIDIGDFAEVLCGDRMSLERSDKVFAPESWSCEMSGYVGLHRFTDERDQDAAVEYVKRFSSDDEAALLCGANWLLVFAFFSDMEDAKDAFDAVEIEHRDC